MMIRREEDSDPGESRGASWTSGEWHLDKHGEEPTPNPSQEGNFQQQSALGEVPSWEGQGWVGPSKGGVIDRLKRSLGCLTAYGSMKRPGKAGSARIESGIDWGIILHVGNRSGVFPDSQASREKRK